MKHIFYLLLILSIASCSTTKHVQAVPVETIREVTKTDTLYINNVQYDSIFVNHDRDKEYRRDQRVSQLSSLNSQLLIDTLLIKETNTEYRYRLLRDTIYRTNIEIKRDSIPYEVRVVETKEVRYTPWYAKTFAWIGVICIVLIVLYIVLKLVIKR